MNEDRMPERKDLRIAVKREYFEQIKAGTKTREYRLRNDYWCGRLPGKHYDTVTITNGYPKKGDAENTITRPYCGYEITTITHKHFGPEPVNVFAIILDGHRPLTDRGNQ